MENVAEALKMAAAVLVFVLALSISINAFGEARQSAQIVLNSQDRDYDDNTYLDNNGETERIVSLETIIPSIYKAYKENYKIVFDTSKIPEGLYLKKDKAGNYNKVFSIDLENEVLGSNAQKERFIMAILYGANEETKTEFSTNLGIILNDEGLYDIIKKGNITFVEKLGVYYQEEVQGQSDSLGNNNANKTKKRVITYTDNN